MESILPSSRKTFRPSANRVATLICLPVLLCLPIHGIAGEITLASAWSFAVLGGAGVTIGGACCSIVSGSVADYPFGLSSISGFSGPGSLVNGSFSASDQLPLVASQAQADENTAYNALAALPSTANETGVTLGTGGTVSTLLPGVYLFSSSAQVDGALTLNFNGMSNASFVFQVGSTLTTGSSAAIDVIGADSTDSIYWQVGSSATLGSSTSFAGNILALDSVTLDPSASIACGRALAYTGSVTMAATNFISDDCSLFNTPSGYSSAGPTDFDSAGFSGGSQSSEESTTPEPTTVWLLAFGLAALTVWYSLRRTLSPPPSAQAVPFLADHD